MGDLTHWLHHDDGCKFWDIAICTCGLSAAIDAAEARAVGAPDATIWAVGAFAEMTGKIGYRLVQVSGGNENEAIGCGVLKMQERNPGWTIHTPAALKIETAALHPASPLGAVTLAAAAELPEVRALVDAVDAVNLGRSIFNARWSEGQPSQRIEGATWDALSTALAPFERKGE